jgi:hypothetical protein
MRNMARHPKLRLNELENLVLGDFLGEGMSRKVYVCKLNPLYVVKVEAEDHYFQNVMEWEAWNWVSGDDAYSKWMAECISISPCGVYLVQKRVEPIREDELPKRVPEFLCDLKTENFGVVDGHLVCRDYGTIMNNLRWANRKLVKAEWN